MIAVADDAATAAGAVIGLFNITFGILGIGNISVKSKTVD